MTSDRTPEGSSGRVLLEEFRLSRGIALRWAVVSTGGFVCVALLLGSLGGWIDGRPRAPMTVGAASPAEVLLALVPVALTVAIVVAAHELLHGALMSRYGDRPSYGVSVACFVLPYAYARSDGGEFTRNELLVVLLAPLAGITAVGALLLPVLPSDLVALALAVNAAGSIGDLWMAAVLFRFPPGVRVAALPDGGGSGFGVYGEPDRGSRARVLAVRAATAFVYGALAAFTAVVALVVLAVLGSLAFGTGTVVIGDPDGPWFLVEHELDPRGGGATVAFGRRPAAAASALGGLLAAVVSVSRTLADR